MRHPLRPALLALLLVPGCVGAPAPPPVSPTIVARPEPAPPRPLAADWQDWPLTPGAWRYAPRPGGGSARFGAAGGALTIACSAATRQVTLGTVAGLRGPVTVRTSSTTRTFAAGDGAVALAARDPLLDAIAFSRGRFTVEQQGAPPIVLPAQAEIGRVIEDCRG